MKLYMVPLAPNPTKVMLYIAERAELGIDMKIDQVVINTVKGRQKEPEHLERNPFGTLPVLELDDGSHLIESLVIIDYLEELFPVDRLQCGDLRTRALGRDLERTVELRLARPLGQYCHSIRSPLGWAPDPAKAEAEKAVMQAPLDYLEELLADGRPFLFGDRVTLADLTLQASLQLMRYISEDILGDRLALRAWDGRYRKRPAAKAVLKW